MSARLMLPIAAMAACLAAPAFGQSASSAFDQALAEAVARKGIKTTEAFARAVEQAGSELRAGSYLLAAQKLGEAYTESKEHPLPAFLIGLTCMGMRDYDRASEFLKYSLQCWPELPKAGPDLAWWLSGREELERIQRELEDELFSRRPGTPEGSRALWLAGLAQAFGGDAKKAATYLGAVPRSAPEWAAANLVLLVVQPRSRPKRAGPDPFETGNRLFVEGRYAEAAHAFGSAVVADPTEPLAYFELGHSLFAAGYFRHAARALALGLERKPDWPDAPIDREAFYPEDRRSDYRDQLQRLEAWALAHPEDGAAQFLLGYNRFFSQLPAASRPAFEAASKAGWDRQAAAFLRRLASGPPRPGEKPKDGDKPRPPPVEPPKPADPFKSGVAKLAQGDHEGALEEFSRGVEDAAQSRAADSMLGVAAAWLGKGEFAKAARWTRLAYGADGNVLDRAGAETAFGPGDLFRRKVADVSKAARELDASRLAQKALTDADRDIWFLCGCSLYISGRPEEAAERFNEIILEWGELDASARELYLRIRKKS